MAARWTKFAVAVMAVAAVAVGGVQAFQSTYLPYDEKRGVESLYLPYD